MRLSLETRVTEDVAVIRCKGRIAYGIEAAALSGEIAELAPQTRRVVIDLSGVEMIDAAGLGELVSVAVAAQASGCSIMLAAPGDFIRHVLRRLGCGGTPNGQPCKKALRLTSPPGRVDPSIFHGTVWTSFKPSPFAVSHR